MTVLRPGRRAHNVAWASVLVGVLLGSVTVGLSLTGLSVLTDRGHCTAGDALVNVTNALVPVVLLNSPFNSTRGEASEQTSYLGSGVNLTFPAWNGSVWGFFNTTNWTIRQGTGPSGAGCSSVYFATETSERPEIGLTLGTFSNDSGEPSNLTLNDSSSPTAGGSIHFWNGFYTPSFSISTCGTGSELRTVTSDHLTIGINFQPGGNSESLNVTIEQSTVYQYEFPANAGTWAVDNLSAPGGPGGGWAFDFVSPCS